MSFPLNQLYAYVNVFQMHFIVDKPLNEIHLAAKISRSSLMIRQIVLFGWLTASPGSRSSGHCSNTIFVFDTKRSLTNSKASYSKIVPIHVELSQVSSAMLSNNDCWRAIWSELVNMAIALSYRCILSIACYQLSALCRRVHVEIRYIFLG